ncbi:MAG: Ger(x)C family spore germination protein [Bacilli bacterium]|nr:Ger(x)C family spore germination protein [Bacilli bacterium]
MKKILLIIPLLFLLAGCSDYKEVNEMAIVSGVGIDHTEDGFEVTLEVLNEKVDKNSGKVSSYTRTASDPSIAVAIEKAADLLTHRAYYSHVKLVVISEEVAENFFEEITDFFIRSTYLRENFNVVVSRDTSPEEIFTTTTDENPIASSAILLLLQSNAFASNFAVDQKYYLVLQEIIDFGKDTAISCINVEKKDFFIDGLAIFDEYKMIDILTNDDAVIYNILRKEIRKPVFTLEFEGEAFTIALYDIKSDIEVKPDKINVKAVYRAKIMSNGPNFNIKSDEVLTKINDRFSELLNQRIETFIKTIQKKNTDILSLANSYYVNTRDKNDNLWQHAEVKSDAKVVINKKGLVYNIYENN